MSRLATIGDGTNTYAAYRYLGAGRIVAEDYEDIEVRLDYAADNFAALDRFGRVLDQLWTDYGADPDVVLDHYSYTYDRAGNRTSRTNELNHDFDELYDYDGIDRLISAVRADDFDQSWALDGLGNFAEFDDDGDTQTRTVNGVNEIAGITGGWISPSYDAAGDMISAPKPGDETTRVHYVYDAWNRLVKVYDDDSGAPGDLIAEYEYDGTNRRIEKEITEAGGGPTHAHYYFNHDWQLLEERFVDEQDELLASNQYVWSARYIDAPLVRFHDGNGDGDLLDVDDNIRYYTGDANYNVTATIDAAPGEVVNRYVYTAYGKATLYDDDWSNPSAPTTDGPLYCGYFFDAETALYQVRNRYYDAALSMFINRDPIKYEGGMNLYAYVGDSPLTRTDPTGLENFYVCGRDIDSRGGTKACCASACGCYHFDIYGDQSGLVLSGWDRRRGEFPPVAGGGTVPTGPGWKCYPLRRAHKTLIPIPSPVSVPPLVLEKTIRWGPAKGKSCKDASSADILDCFRGKPKRTGDPGILENCQTDCLDAAEGCCLTGLRPATIIPPPQIFY
jgi:RHS repeat-associated protein